MDRPRKKMTNRWLMMLATISATLLAAWGIWSDDDLMVKPKKRKQHSTYNRDAFSLSLKNHILQSFSSEFCQNPVSVFNRFLINEDTVTGHPLKTLDTAYPSAVEQEALRRCKTSSPSPKSTAFCFVMKSNLSGNESDNFLASDQVLVEIKLNFRSPHYELLSCQDALSSNAGDISMELYYSLYWPFSQNQGQPSYHITGGMTAQLTKKPFHNL